LFNSAQERRVETKAIRSLSAAEASLYKEPKNIGCIQASDNCERGNLGVESKSVIAFGQTSSPAQFSA
jgi:hypothetical protein